MENQPKTSPPAQANFSPHNAIQTSPIVRENRRSGNTGCALRGPPLTLVVRTFRWRVFFSFFPPLFTYHLEAARVPPVVRVPQFENHWHRALYYKKA